MLTQVGVKQLTDFLRTETAASDLVDCTLVNCDTVTNKSKLCLNKKNKKLKKKTKKKHASYELCPPPPPPPQPKGGGGDILCLVRILLASASVLLRFHALSFEPMDGF